MHLANFHSNPLTRVKTFGRIIFNNYDDEDGRRMSIFREPAVGARRHCSLLVLSLRSRKPKTGCHSPEVDAFRFAALRQRACWSP